VKYDPQKKSAEARQKTQMGRPSPMRRLMFVNGLRARDKGVGISKMVVKCRDRRPRAEYRPIGHAERYIPIVIQHGEPDPGPFS
jgi:hypothetical protein